ncbi:hypothetical protein DHEL01_v212264 [Diaporthe helianthi]|uniref:Uncharacterized protein n=1 Tax=Diaporthe helianthi TaxID=158607 RepID=A0A2P5HGG5_DIAHE|nr:hypothetical protein DHEL01_v212264 [Diaporthe helianthi]
MSCVPSSWRYVRTRRSRPSSQPTSKSSEVPRHLLRKLARRGRPRPNYSYASVVGSLLARSLTIPKHAPIITASLLRPEGAAGIQVNWFSPSSLLTKNIQVIWR